ncbi:MAG: response regulator containing a CheY-like receiver domain and an DNA-binding domain [Mycobacterium sp.]|nr:response regulator containing a CheY-like receiver domain and an DNA-binding domain [Mycobacterium sp.]
MPQDDSKPVPDDDGTAQWSAGTLEAAAEALTRLRGVLDNDELTERIPTELRECGFTRLLFSRAGQHQGPPGASDVASPRASSHVTVPILLGLTPVGHLHVDDPGTHGGTAALLRVVAEGVGVIFERNVLAERLRTMHTSARDHARTIGLLSESFTHLNGTAMAHRPG